MSFQDIKKDQKLKLWLVVTEWYREVCTFFQCCTRICTTIILVLCTPIGISIHCSCAKGRLCYVCEFAGCCEHVLPSRVE